jgi:hypothetical protein
MFVALNQACASTVFLWAALASLAWARAGQMAQPLVLAETVAPNRPSGGGVLLEQAARFGASLHDVRAATASAFVR